MKKVMNQAEFEAFKENYFNQERIRERYQIIHDRFETRVKGAISARDRSRSGQTDEAISITLYDWMMKYLSLTDRFDVIEPVIIEGIEGKIVVDYFTKQIVFEAKE